MKSMVFPLLLFALAACSGGFTEADPRTFGAFRIDVTNELAPRAQIYLVQEGEEEGERMGDAPVEGTTTFRIDIAEPSETYTLRAQFPRDRVVESEEFVPEEVRGLRWDLATNVLTPEEFTPEER